MRLHTCFITFNRLELTEQAVESYLATVTMPYSYVVVDNGSSDGTEQWLAQSQHPYLLLAENRYPGYACNRGWERAPADVTLLQRADNDFSFLPGWCEEVERCFRDPQLGQLGLRTDEEEQFVPLNVAGNCVIRRRLWEEGLRWDVRPWGEYVPGYGECAGFSATVLEMGYRWDRVQQHVIDYLSTDDWDDPYYAESFGVRGIVRQEAG